ncbi:MAG TPA: CHAT domain-containing protein [Allocoleopsis sp.]
MKSLLKFFIIAILSLCLNIFGSYYYIHATSNQNLIQTAKQYYDQGQYSQSVEYLQKAVTTYENNKDIINQIQALSWLSLAQQKLGNWIEAEKSINTSINLLQNIPNIPPIIKAQVYNAQAHLQLAKGDNQSALSNWQKTEFLYDQANDTIGIIGSKINQVKSLEKLGLYHQSEVILNQIEPLITTISEPELQVISLYNLGNFYTKKGNIVKAEATLSKSLEIGRKLNNVELESRILLSLGNINYSLAKSPVNDSQTEDSFKKARDYYQKAAKITPVKLTKIQGRNNEINLIINLVKPSRKIAYLQELLPNIRESLNHINGSRESIFTQMNLVNNLLKIDYNLVGISDKELGESLANAVKQARILKDERAESEVLGILAKLYQKTGQIDQSLTLNKQALIIAQNINAEDISFRLWSLLGQIYEQKGNQEQALKSYEQSIKIIKTLRSDLVGLNQDLQFSFREGIEPIYRQYVNLLLTENPSQENLKKARETIEGLQLAELDNFFKEACLTGKPKQIEEIDKKAAVIYPIILPKKLAVIVSLPGQNLKYYYSDVEQQKVEDMIKETRKSLTKASEKYPYKFSNTLYNWLIKDGENDLKKSQIETLVFVLDGDLRSLPMSVLYDGEKYLIEKYNIALSPGLQLLPPKSLTTAQFKLLIGAITQARPGFNSLPYVKDEVKNLANNFQNQNFVDEQFTKEKLQEVINKIPFPVVHLATHGKFSSNPEQTYILTWNEKLKINELEQLIKGREKNQIAPIELLVLSACQTASGDKRAALGLAGLAVKSGVRSTVASLWSVDDEATSKLIFEFYQQLSKGINKAAALKQAQMKLINDPKHNHPVYWSAFVLVGNWL